MALIMKLITSVCFICAIGFLILYHTFTTSVFLTLAITCATTFYHFSMRLAVGAIYQALLHNQIDYRKRWFQSLPFEQKFYSLIGVKKWKNKLPTFEPVMFVVSKSNCQQTAMVMCQSELVHETIMILSFVPVLFSVQFGAFWVFFITSLDAACIDALFVILQRYNRPRILKMLQKYEQLEKLRK